MEVTAIASEIFLREQSFDDRRTGGRCAESALGHGFGEGFVIEQFTCAFHGGEQGCFVESCGWLGGVCFDLDLDGCGIFSSGDADEFVFVGGDADFATIDFHPAGFDEDFAIGLEGID